MVYYFTRHVLERKCQRRITFDELYEVLRNTNKDGRVCHNDIVVVKEGKTLITCWRSRRKTDKKKVVTQEERKYEFITLKMEPINHGKLIMNN